MGTFCNNKIRPPFTLLRNLSQPFSSLRKHNGCISKATSAQFCVAKGSCRMKNLWTFQATEWTSKRRKRPVKTAKICCAWDAPSYRVCAHRLLETIEHQSSHAFACLVTLLSTHTGILCIHVCVCSVVGRLWRVKHFSAVQSHCPTLLIAVSIKDDAPPSGPLDLLPRQLTPHTLDKFITSTIYECHWPLFFVTIRYL